MTNSLMNPRLSAEPASGGKPGGSNPRLRRKYRGAQTAPPSAPLRPPPRIPPLPPVTGLAGPCAAASAPPSSPPSRSLPPSLPFPRPPLPSPAGTAGSARAASGNGLEEGNRRPIRERVAGQLSGSGCYKRRARGAGLPVAEEALPGAEGACEGERGAGYPGAEQDSGNGV